MPSYSSGGPSTGPRWLIPATLSTKTLLARKWHVTTQALLAAAPPRSQFVAELENPLLIQARCGREAEREAEREAGKKTGLCFCEE